MGSKLRDAGQRYVLSSVPPRKKAQAEDLALLVLTRAEDQG